MKKAVPFREARETTLYGSKAVGLGDAARHGLPVPPGVALSGDLVEAVLAAIPPAARDKRIHPATRTFQAIRIVVNGELEGLDEALRDAAASLNPKGVLAVLSYHSGEDRAVKRVFRDLASDKYVELTKKPVKPSESEVRRNTRSRSAKLRALQRS